MNLNWPAIIIFAVTILYVLIIYSICKLNGQWDRKEEREQEQRLDRMQQEHKSSNQTD